MELKDRVINMTVGIKRHRVWKLFLKLMVVIVFYEALIMALFTAFSIPDGWKLFIDPLLLAMMIAPAIYRIIIKPMRNTLDERAHIETTLRENEQKLKTILENTNSFIYTVSSDYRFEFLNSQWLKKIGYNPIEKGQFCYEAIAGIDHPCPDCNNAHVFAGEKLKFEKTTADGTTFDIYNVPLYHSDGRVSKLSIGHDVTERKQMQERLREKEKFLKDVFEAITHPIYVINPADYSLVVYNEVARRCYDYTDVEMQNITCYATTHHASAPCHDKNHPCPIEIIKKTKQPAHVEHIHYDHNGKPRRFDVYAYPIFDENQNIKQVIEYSLDITERKKMEEQLQNSEKRFRELAELLPQTICETDRQGNILFANRHAFDIFGYSPQDLDRNLNILQFVTPADGVRAGKNLTKLLAGEQLEGVEYTAIRKDGSTFPIIAYGDPIIAQDKVVGARAIIVDVTNLKYLEEQLRQSQKLEGIGQLAGGIAHDFNNILTAINGYAELTLMRLDAEKDKHIVNNIKQVLKSGQKAANLVRQLLAFSRKQIIQPQILDVNNVIFDLYKMLRRIIGEDIQIKMVLHDEVASIKADPAQMEQVIINLVVNARDAINQKTDRASEKKIIVETQEVVLDEEYTSTHIGSNVGTHILISIRDNGAGMDETTLRRIFEPFFTTKEVGQGTGLGLSTVYGIVKQNQGSISVDSTLGKGTTFRIYWPALRREAELGEKGKPGKEEVPGGHEAILFAEDDDAVRTISVNELRLRGYQVYEACNGMQALALATNNKLQFDLLITDMVMPEMNGEELSRELKRLFPKIKILFSSGYVDSPILRHAAPGEETNFIAKPYSLTTLAGKVRNVLDTNQAEAILVPE